MNEFSDDRRRAVDLIQFIGSPFVESERTKSIEQSDVERLYDLAFENRVELLYLQALEKNGMPDLLADRRAEMTERCTTTRKIAAETSVVLSEAGIDHVVFKSIKPYPATPNDTDVVCFGGDDEYQRGIDALCSKGYVVQDRAPMQTLMYHPSGEGKVGKGKKGGTYYVDFYRGVAVDYYEYVSKPSIAPYVVSKEVEGKMMSLLAPEPELAIVMFHNVFPEKTFQLEHFYLCLYGMNNSDFRLDHMISYAESNHMVEALRSNLTIIAELHKRAFGTVPQPVSELLLRWQPVAAIAQDLRDRDYAVTYVFSALVFWKVFALKLKDPFSRRSLGIQVIHMMNPVFFWDAFTSAWTRTFDRDIYIHQ